MSPTSAPVAQLGLDGLEPHLASVPFVVVDLETTGTSPDGAEITELGAVRVRGGRVESEISTFVRIDGSVPPAITELTGIRDADLVAAPSLGEVVATFAEFARGAVLVAHNARFDSGFLRAAFERTGHPWPEPVVLCTLGLSRRIFAGDVRNHRLGTLAAFVGSPTTPDHRALTDARATVDVLHALLARVGDCGVETVSDLRAYDTRLAPAVRRRRELTDELPGGPGVYVFRDSAGGALYVGSSVDVRRRARSYFSGGDSRTRMRTMVGLVAGVEAVPAAHLLEAWTVEERLIDSLQPPFNRRSRRPRAGWWTGPAPGGRAGLTSVRTPGPGCVGPFRTRGRARAVADAVLEAQEGLDDATRRAEWAALVDGSEDAIVTRLRAVLGECATRGEFEHGRRLRDAAADLVFVTDRLHESAGLAACPEVVLAQRAERGAWALAVVRYGRFSGGGRIDRGADPSHVVAHIRSGATVVLPDEGPLRGATPAEVAAVHRWIDLAPTRVVAAEPGWELPTPGVRAHLEWARAARAAADEAGAAGSARA